MRTLLVALVLCVSAVAQGVGTVAFNATAYSGGVGLGTVLYFGAGCSGASSQTCSAGSTATAWSIVGYPVGLDFTTRANAAGYTATDCGVRFTAKDGTLAHYRCAIYLAATNVLVANCYHTTNQSISGTPPLWQEAAFPASCTLAANTTYRFMFEVDGAGTFVGYTDLTNIYPYATMAYGAWPTPITTSMNARRYSQYVKMTAN